MKLSTTIVLTGGPQGGKSTLLRRLAEDPELQGQLTVVPEAATILFSGGHPTPDETWGEEHWYQLQLAVTSLQMSLEKSLVGRAALVVCDRAPFDNLAYASGRQALKFFWGTGFAAQMSRYDMVLHMESLATAEPERFGRLGNAVRFEALPEAQALEMRTREAWSGHPNRHFVSGGQPFEDVLDEAMGLVRAHFHAAVGR